MYVRLLSFPNRGNNFIRQSIHLPERMSAESFSHPEHEPVFLAEIIETASDEIRQLCGDNAECIFDAIQTGRTDIALDTLETDITNTNDQMITGKFTETY